MVKALQAYSDAYWARVAGRDSGLSPHTNGHDEFATRWSRDMLTALSGLHAGVVRQSFPTPGGKWHVSTNGGERSVWSRDGKELYFLSPEGTMMVAEVKSGSKFETSAPKSLFNVRLARSIDSWFDVSKDGRILIPVQVEQTAKAPITVVVNWQAGLKK